MDDDTTTMAHVRQNIADKVVKVSDLNHVKKNLGNKLYEIKKTENVMSQMVISYFQKCFAYAIRQHENNADGLARALKQIVPHAFGKHEGCDSSWCRGDTEGYKHKSLPRGCDLKVKICHTTGITMCKT